MHGHRRGPWSSHEDAMLVELVKSQGAHNWVRISALIGSRTPKQCRERFHQNLKPSLNHDPITPEEGLVIEQLVADMGKRWAEIARRLNGRSDNAVKNWWNGGMNRKKRLEERKGVSRRGRYSFNRDHHHHHHHHQNHPPSPTTPTASPTSSISSASSSSASCCSSGQDRSSSSPSPAPLASLQLFVAPHGSLDDSSLSPSYPQFSEYSSRVRTPSLVSDTTSSFSNSPTIAPASLPPYYSPTENVRPPLLGHVHSYWSQPPYQPQQQHQRPSSPSSAHGSFSYDPLLPSDQHHLEGGHKMSLGFVCS